MHSDPVFWGIDKKPSGYGTYKVRVTFANEYHYGRDLAERLVKNTSYRITHDEDAEFDLEDFIDDITEICYEMAEKYHDEKEEAE
jgi:hypothetical protein